MPEGFRLQEQKVTAQGPSLFAVAGIPFIKYRKVWEGESSK